MLRERDSRSVRALELAFERHHHQTMLFRFLFAVITKQTELPMLSEIPRDVASGALRPSVCLTSCSLIRRFPDIFLHDETTYVPCWPPSGRQGLQRQESPCHRAQEWFGHLDLSARCLVEAPRQRS